MKIIELNGLKNKSRLKLVALNAMIVAILFASSCIAQTQLRGKRSGGWGMGNQYDTMYNTKTIETLVGEVKKVEKIIPMKGMSTGVHLLVKTNNETISIHLGPEWYIDKQDIEISKNDEVEIKGSRITYEGKPAIIAAEITKGKETMVLRNEYGIPIWRGWRQK